MNKKLHEYDSFSKLPDSTLVLWLFIYFFLTIKLLKIFHFSSFYFLFSNCFKKNFSAGIPYMVACKIGTIYMVAVLN